MLWRAVQAASLGFVGLLVIGLLTSRWLPPRAAANSETGCYWTDALFVFVQCGPRAPLGWLREPVYNLYFALLYPFAGVAHIRSAHGVGWFYLIAGLAAWVAVAVGVLTLGRLIRRAFNSPPRWPR